VEYEQFNINTSMTCDWMSHASILLRLRPRLREVRAGTYVRVLRAT
jgi:hypothetical protein